MRAAKDKTRVSKSTFSSSLLAYFDVDENGPKYTVARDQGYANRELGMCILAHRIRISDILSLNRM